MHAKMRVYAGLANYVVYANLKSAFQQNGSSSMIAIKISLTANRQYGRSGKMVYLLSNACYGFASFESLFKILLSR